MAQDPTKIKLGPCNVSWNGIDLGLTIGGVDVTLKSDTHMTKVDQKGTTPVNEFVTGRTLTVKCPLAQTDLDTLFTVMSAVGASRQTVTGGSKVNGTTTQNVSVTTGTGASLFDTAAILVLHPVAKLVTDKSEDFTVPIAGTAGDLNFTYDINKERVYDISFTGYPDPTTDVLFIYGDTTGMTFGGPTQTPTVSSTGA